MNKLYKVTESVSGEEKMITADSPIKAIIIYLENEEVNEKSDIWNWDFEVERTV